MILENTTPSQDEQLSAAESSVHISNLIAIAVSLDEKITKLKAAVEEWKSAADEWGCSTPDELRDKILSLPETY